MRHYGGHWASKFLLLPVTHRRHLQQCIFSCAIPAPQIPAPTHSSSIHSPHKHLEVSAVYWIVPGAGATSMHKPESLVSLILKEFKSP